MLLLGTPYSVVGVTRENFFRGGIILWGLKCHVSCPLRGWSYPITRALLTLGQFECLFTASHSLWVPMFLDLTWKVCHSIVIIAIVPDNWYACAGVCGL